MDTALANQSSDLVDADAQLLESLRRGDAQAFETLVRANTGRMLTVARRLLGNEEDAQDAVQDAFVSAFRSLGSFQSGSRIATWLHRIVINAALMKLRSKKRKREQAIDELLPRFHQDGHAIHPQAPWGNATESALMQRETMELVRRCIDRLPESYRTVLLLRDIEEVDTEETARLLEISTSAVKTRLHRARLALKTLLDPYMHKESP